MQNKQVLVFHGDGETPLISQNVKDDHTFDSSVVGV